MVKGKRLTERDLFQWLKQSDLKLGPVQLRPITIQPIINRRLEADAYLEATWQGWTANYVCELKALNTPKSVDAAIAQAQRLSYELKLLPLILLPYLSEERLVELESLRISGLDLCGNGVLLAPEFSVWRTGNENRFRESTTLKNIYSGDSSIFTRCFLLQKSFNSLAGLQVFAEQNTLLKPRSEGNALRLGTSSKVVQSLSEELLVSKDKDGLTLIDARRLMENLKSGYKPRRGQSLIGRSPLDRDQIWKRLRDLGSRGDIRYVATGIASAGYYRVLSGVERLSLYADQIEPMAQILEIKEGRGFANVEIIEAEKNLPFFDIRKVEEAAWASPIQTWLELSQAGPRESEAADALGKSILSRLKTP